MAASTEVTTGGRIDEAKDSIIAIVTKLKENGNTGANDKFFPKGINYVSIDITFDPTKPNLHAALVVSSDAVKPAVEAGAEE